MTTNYRDAVTGEYVTEEYAARHPDTTVAEVDNDDELEAVEEAEGEWGS